jgi:apolipoprotein D and lipocalin family protein
LSAAALHVRENKYKQENWKKQGEIMVKGLFHGGLLIIGGLMLISGLTSCAPTTANIPAVKEFEPEKYLGTWYEIARLPNSFEKGLSDITATYKLRKDGGIDVLNRGYNTGKMQWSEVSGKAYFTGERNTGELEVTFFWPFYGAYKIIHLDKNYRYAMVTSNRMTYLWILSRTPEMPANIKSQFVQQAAALGFPVAQLIFVERQLNY